MRKVIFGAGKKGIEAFNALGGDVFCDSNAQVRKKVNGISPRELNGEDEVYITCLDINRAYGDCIVAGCDSQKVWIYWNNKVTSYKELSLEIHNADYSNEAYYKYLYENEKKTREHIIDFEATHNLKDNISEVAIMLSNLCNYASIHKLCPASCVKDKEIMPTSAVLKILDELSENGYAGSVCFHLYNEPTMDPRLFLFIKMAKDRGMKVHLLTNGYYLNQVMLDEYVAIGVDLMTVTAYGSEEYERLLNLKIETPYSVHFGVLDERMDLYEQNTNSCDGYQRCEQLFKLVSIYSNGDVGICCVDYKHPYPLGNIYQENLLDILQKERTVNYQLDLLNGKREYDLCKNCFYDCSEFYKSLE